MTREEAIKLLECSATELVGTMMQTDEQTAVNQPQRYVDAYDMAIAALREQETVTNRNGLTNADHIRAMSDEELADLLCTADWCETCDQMREEGTCKAMELDGPLSKHCVSAALRWLRQPYKEEA